MIKYWERFRSNSGYKKILSVDSRNFKKWGDYTPNTAQNVGDGLKNSGGQLYDKV